MNIRSTAIALLVGFLAVSLHATTPAAEIEVIVDQLHPKAIRVGSGKTYGDTMLAIASEKGLVVVDTGTTVRATRAYRAKIEEVFGRKDFLYIVNTHFHYDHVVGNPIFPEATVISHELTREWIINWNRTREQFVAQQQARVDGWLTTLETADPADDETVRLQGLVEKYSWMSEDLRGDYEPHLPTITFSDRLHFDLGDITMDLYYFGPGTHTGDDIMVHFPEIGVVATGDLLHDQSIQFLRQVEPGADIPYKVEVFDAILADPNLEHVVPVHCRVMNRDEFQIRRDYANDVWNGVTNVIESGGSLAKMPANSSTSEPASPIWRTSASARTSSSTSTKPLSPTPGCSPRVRRTPAPPSAGSSTKRVSTMPWLPSMKCSCCATASS